MKLQIDLLHVASGPFFFASGKARPDSYRFERVKGEEHIHRLTIDDVNGDKAAAVLKDLGLRLQQADHPVLFKIVVEDGDLDGASEIARLKQELEAAGDRVSELEEKATKQPKEEAPVAKALTAEQEEFLAERDEMLVLLEPLAEGEDTPLDVLKRAVAALAAPPPKKK